MRGRLACLLVAALLVAGCGGGGSARLSLATVEKAFHDAKIPFAADWQPHASSPYLLKRDVTNPTAAYPSTFARHIVGWAGFVDPRTYVSRTAFVFDNGTSASAFARWWDNHSTGNQANHLVAKNVVYVGAISPAVTTVMKSLGS